MVETRWRRIGLPLLLALCVISENLSEELLGRLAAFSLAAVD